MSSIRARRAAQSSLPLSLGLVSAGLLLAGLAAGLPARAQVPPAAAAAAPAAPVPAGMVKRVSGAATLERGGQRSPLAAGTVVQVGDTLRTGPDGAAGITLADDTLLALGPESELVLSQFSFDNTTHEGGLMASLWRGTLGLVTGLIGRKSPEKVQVQTRTVVLGVRGTEFIVDASGATR